MLESVTVLDARHSARFASCLRFHASHPSLTNTLYHYVCYYVARFNWSGTHKQLTTLSLKELRKLSASISTEISKRNKGLKHDLLKRMEKLVSEHGMTLTDIFPVEAQAKTHASKPKVAAPKKPKLPNKYWNPLNPNEGWSGHARRPQWVLNWIGNGGKLEELTVKRT